MNIRVGDTIQVQIPRSYDPNEVYDINHLPRLYDYKLITITPELLEKYGVDETY